MSLPALSLDALGGYVELARGGPRPVIDRGRARITEVALNQLLRALPLAVTLSAGGAELRVKAGSLEVTATLVVEASPTGRLRLEATRLRLGSWLPAPPNLVAFALGRLEGQRGIYIDGPRSVELDLAELLHDLPVALDVRVSRVRVEPGCLELHCVPRVSAKSSR